MDSVNSLSDQNIGLNRLEFNMLPMSEHTIHIEDFLYLDDNLSISDKRHFFAGENYHLLQQIPVKFMMTMAILCTEGCINARINQTDIEAVPGDLLVIFPGSIAEWVDIQSDSRFLVCAMNYSPKNIEHVPSKSIIEIGKSFLGSGSPTLFHLDKEHSDLIIKLYSTQREISSIIDKDYLVDATKSFLASMTCIVASSTKNSPKPKGISQSRETETFAKFMQDIHEFSTKERSVSFYADRACLSPKYFARIITKTSGQKPGHWIKDYVILEAKTMLGTGKYTIQQISDNLNFPNPSFFCKYFRSATGCSPGQYCKEHQGYPEPSGI